MQPQPGAQTQTVGRPMEILLVEDNLMDAHLTITALRDSEIKHRLTPIPDGEEAIEFLDRKGKFARAPRPDLILLDLHLPKKDGLEVLSAIRESDELKRIPVVILTASDSDEDRSQCEFLDVNAYITKPVNLDKFLGVVKKLKRYWLHDVILPT